MIKNIIFDLGNVLLSFKPEEYFENNGYSEEAKRTIISEIFKSREWSQIDNGEINIPGAIESISARSSLKSNEITAVFNLRTKIIFPLDFNTKLLPVLRKQGFMLYYLSNFPDDIFDEVFNQYSFFNFFDGGIISARVKASKPDKKIFRIFIEKYSLAPDECLFIDDSEPNVTSAILTGMTGIYLHKTDDLQKLIEKVIGKSLIV
jgi:FMN phosphatase YigB (HAD superfamily)